MTPDPRPDVSPARARAGALYLDSAEPGWQGRIDLDRLDISTCVDCVLAQVCGGHYGDMLGRIALTNPECHARPLAWAAVHGFNSYRDETGETTRGGLNEAWRLEVLARRGLASWIEGPNNQGEPDV